MKKTILILLALALAAGAGWYLLVHKKSNGVQFRTVRVTRGDLRAKVTATGTVNAVKNVLVGTQISGTIKEIFVDFNSPVKQGQLLAQIDPALSEAVVAQAKANLQAAVANVEKAESALADANRTLERNRTLFAKNYIARSDLDAAETAQASAKATLNANKAQVEQQKATLNHEETNLRYTRILSPVNGIVISRNVDIGQTVAASFQTPTLFSIAEDLTRMEIDTNVDEADIGKIHVNQDVEFTVDAYPDTTFRGRVSEVRNAPTTIQNVVTYTVIVKVANPDLKLKPGMTANVSIVTAVEQGVLTIPNSALRFKWQLAGNAAATGAQGGGASADAAAAPGAVQSQGQVAGAGAAGADGKAYAGKSGGGYSATAVGAGSGTGQGSGERKGRPAGGADGQGYSGRSGGRGGEAGAQGAGSPAEGRGGSGQAAGGKGTASQMPQRGRGGAMTAVQGVWVLDGQTPRRISITPGISDGSNTAVLGGELKEGDLVIVEATGPGKSGNNQKGPQGPRFL